MDTRPTSTATATGSDESARLRRENEDLKRRLTESEARLRIAHHSALQSLVRAIEFKDPYRRGHYELVAKYAVATGKRLGMNEESLDRLRVGGMLMDIGKVVIDSSLLVKTEPLTEAEQKIIRSHVEIGARILDPIVDPWEIGDVVFQHHERWNGTGYPRGLRENDILPEARILGICDSFVAMVAARAFRKAFSRDLAIASISEEADRLFDPDVARAFVAVVEADRDAIVESLSKHLGAEPDEPSA